MRYEKSALTFEQQIGLLKPRAQGAGRDTSRQLSVEYQLLSPQSKCGLTKNKTNTNTSSPSATRLLPMLVDGQVTVNNEV